MATAVENPISNLLLWSNYKDERAMAGDAAQDLRGVEGISAGA
jgi:hypothetical protein